MQIAILSLKLKNQIRKYFIIKELGSERTLNL